jgi:V/A-type H+-transporting ATPase subunit I
VLVPMAKVEIIGPKSKFFDVVDMLHEHGKLHIEDLSKKIESHEVRLDQMEVVQSQEQERERMGELLIRVRAVIKALQLPGTHIDEARRQKEYLRLWKLDSRQLSDEIAHVVEEVEEKTSGLSISQTELEAELALLARYEPILAKIQPLAKQIVTTGAFDSVALLVERKYKGALDQLKDELDVITKKQCEIVSTDVDEDTTAAIIVFNKTYSEPVHKFLAIENVNQIRLPSELQGMAFDQAYDTVKERQKTLPQQLDDVGKELEGMSGKWYLRLTTIRDVLSDRIDEISAIPKFGQTEYAFVVSGWIPVDGITDLRKSLMAAFGEEVIVNQLEIDEHDFNEVPVSLQNRKEVAPFEWMLSLRGGVPAYGTLDPTTILAVFYPFIFGMIVGDIGYGAVMLGLVLWLRRKYRDKPGIQMATGLLGPACTMAIAWGFIYGEFFGNLLMKYWISIPIIPKGTFGLAAAFTLPVHRVAGSLALFMIGLSLFMGLVQVTVGLVLGIVNGMKTKHMSHVWEKGGMLGFLGGLLLFGITAIDVFAPAKTVVGILAGLFVVVGLFYAMKGGKAVGLVESISLITSVASYIRIMALGLAGAIFADAVNSLASKLGLLGILVGLLLHSVNILVSAFSPNIHALRLNMLEFAGKFYEPSKQAYKPFQKTGGEKSA